ncbi:MAG: polyprenyl synthetase family protein [Bacteroidales bacterium]|nr:polyprenyl synthetase family protein [Bacteroidales bacterium]MDD3200587.1 polyprenyl synthetase family protein [Bacteroidales bacterium]
MYTLEEIDRIVERSILNMNIMGEPASLYEPIEYMIGIGGKRIRPRLCLATYSLFENNISTEIIYPALSLEIFHEFTLIHDDIMDNADTRRNQMTVYKKWGNNVAILSGDVMSILAYRYLAASPAGSLPDVLNLFSTTAAQVCEGQQYDMDYEQLPFITREDYIKMIGLKTGVLLACSAKMGALLAKASSEICDALYDFGYKLGIAFQITDDYLDTFGNEQVFGKKIGGDIINNKKSWLLVECLRLAANGNKMTSLDNIMAMGEDCQKEKIAAMQQLYVELGVKESAKEAILEYQKKAMDAIENVGLSVEQIQQLREFSEQIIHREK